MAPRMVLQALLEASWWFFGGKLAPKRPSQAMDKGGGRDDTKQVEDVRPRMVRGRRDLVLENGDVGSENREKPQLQRAF